MTKVMILGDQLAQFKETLHDFHVIDTLAPLCANSGRRAHSSVKIREHSMLPSHNY